MWMETVMDDPEVQAVGLCVLIDLSGYSWKIFKWLTPHNLKVCSKLLDLYPVKQFKMHVVNTSILVNASIKLMWPFLSQRIKDMVRRIHSIFHFHYLTESFLFRFSFISMIGIHFINM